MGGGDGERGRVGTGVRQRARGAAGFAWGRLADALPTIVFYIVLYASVVALFGLHYTMIVSSATSLFKSHYAKEATARTYASIVVTNLVLCLLAWVATLELGLCVLLNAIVPLLLVLATSSQFAPKGYFGYAMTFTMLELKPLSPAEFATQFLAVAWSSALVVAGVALWRALRSRRLKPTDEVREGLLTLADVLDRLAAGESPRKLSGELVALERTFDRLRMARHHLLSGERGRELAYGLYALLFQRAIYLLEDVGFSGDDAGGADPDLLLALAIVVREAAQAEDATERSGLMATCRLLLDSADLPGGRLRVFFRSFLHLLMAILRLDAAAVARPETGLAGALEAPRRVVMAGTDPWRAAARELASRMTWDSYEFRFALRLSAVLVASCSVSMAWGFEHSYWLPLNAFLMLQPSYEESAHRMRARPLGTVLGCGLTYLLTLALPGTPWVFAASAVLIAVMYSCSPGSWVQAIFATSFALLMTSLSLNATTAMWLRCLFVALAVALVLVVNRFLAPSRARDVYERSRAQLLGLVREYWDAIAQGLSGAAGTNGELRHAGELLGTFHLHYKEAMDFVAGMPAGEARDRERASLQALWHLFAEVEQVACLVEEGLVTGSDRAGLSAVALLLSDRPDPTSALDVLGDLVGELRSEDLAFVLRRYLERARRWGEEAARDRLALMRDGAR